ncbi:DUF4349 domain-containing protein [Flavobacterium subsaxonicum]|uniref:DUF4349 domain-containing protein n=1 Tax=Flavobacterium subsaxonicum WB 4.1-42 = DSM 21790 TaxID=1121898 RepID=A0A0A2MX21_9FLAO|nr:DUF4349 domain-containing protein [Flavobacterium subsaxonicum]KGO92760.1 hypothetical protein Q766_11630 [Flavobacterium subsaxonicum WB 4.1-42 = DSM 21790]
MKITIYTLMLLLALTACQKSESDNTVRAASVAEFKEMPASEIQNAPPQQADDNASPLPPPGQDGTYQSKIIKNANLNFETPDINATARKVQDAVTKYKALVLSDVESKDNYTLSRNITIRVPSAAFENFVATISQGVTFFDRKEISSQDVTAQFVDSEARLKTKKVLEARYLELLKKATKVSEMLEIEGELSKIREEIEANEGNLKYLQSQVAMSTIVLEFYKRTDSGAGTTVSYGSKMGNAIKSGFYELSSFFLGMLNIWPFILIFVIVFIIIRKKIKKRKNHA